MLSLNIAWRLWFFLAFELLFCFTPEEVRLESFCSAVVLSILICVKVGIIATSFHKCVSERRVLFCLFAQGFPGNSSLRAECDCTSYREPLVLKLFKMAFFWCRSQKLWETSIFILKTKMQLQLFSVLRSNTGMGENTLLKMQESNKLYLVLWISYFTCLLSVWRLTLAENLDIDAFIWTDNKILRI